VVNNIARSVAVAVVIAGGALMPAFGDEEFPIVGLYTKDQACKGDASKRADLQVKITGQNIVSDMGSCAILNKRRNGRAFLVQVECKMAGDLTLLGDVTFTQRDDNTLDFDDQDHTSPAVLHRCGT
jgi:hypothetical protein